MVDIVSNTEQSDCLHLHRQKADEFSIQYLQEIREMCNLELQWLPLFGNTPAGQLKFRMNFSQNELWALESYQVFLPS